MSPDYQSEASNHYIGGGYSHYPQSYPQSRQKKVIITKEYNDKGQLVKEVRTEEWENVPSYYPYWGSGVTYASSGTTTNITQHPTVNPITGNKVR